MNGELLLKPVKAHQAIRIDDIESPYSQIPSLRQTIYARGMAGPVEPQAALDNAEIHEALPSMARKGAR